MFGMSKSTITMVFVTCLGTSSAYGQFGLDKLKTSLSGGKKEEKTKVAIKAPAADQSGLKSPEVKCLGTKTKKVQVGKMDSYKVKDGLAFKEYDGFVNRKDLKMNGCIHENAENGKTYVHWFDKNQFKKANASSIMQCITLEDSKLVDIDDLTMYFTALDGKDILLKCPNKTGYECSQGKNNNRNSEYKKKMKAKNMQQVAFRVPTGSFKKKLWGKKIFCQAYNKKSGDVLVAMSFVMPSNR